MNHAIILAGGIGSRFWPLSSKTKPKQFLNIGSGKSMLEETIRRIRRLVNKENIYIAANKTHQRKIRSYLRKFGIPVANALFEPESKNTLAPIGVLSRMISDIDNEAVCFVLPSDHLIRKGEKFLRCLKEAINIAKRGYIVTLGIRPTRPETGYGYIKIDTRHKTQDTRSYYKVERFIEKPELLRAKKFIKDKRYYWNSGIFVFKPSVMLKEIKRFKPDIHKFIMKSRNRAYFNKAWGRIPSISVDYAIMEKTKNKALVPADYGWVDLGSWQAIEEISKKDRDGNVFKGNGDFLNIGSRNTLIWSNDRLIATLGLRNIVIVDTKDALLVASKEKVQDVKKLVFLLKKRGLCQSNEK